MSFYQLYELNHAALAPWRAVMDATRLAFQNPFNPLSDTTFGRSVAATAELFERTTRRYGKPAFGIFETVVDGRTVPVSETAVWRKPFCSLLHFQRALPPDRPHDPKVLIVAPLSGHYATLLRGTVEAMLPEHEVFVTDWADARMVPVSDGRFDLDDYIDYVIAMLHHLGPNTHVVAVCQPSVPVLAAVALMSEDRDPDLPRTMTLMGGPVDTRLAPTAVNRLAKQRGTEWFAHNTIMAVPFPHPGFMRKVYPGFLQLSGFMAMNFDRHATAHQEFYQHLVDGDGDSAEKHRDFYDEYLAVMDLTAEFYLQTVEVVFVKHLLPNGQMTHRGRPVRTEAIRRTALLTIEGERDDISGVGQTKAAHALCTNLAYEKKQHFLAIGVGHYGVFNGSRFRSEIQPRIADFIRKHHGGANGSLERASAPVNGRRARGMEARLADAFGITALAGKTLTEVTGGMAEGLTAIAGIGPRMVERLNTLGVFEVGQLAEMADDAARALDEALKGRASREDWFGQARRLAGLPDD
ncbi:MAG TPA: polyhydroxyalkanoate depolymerase [Propylenella sp.]